ncbi:single-stranded DNA-binding protein [Levilactobacillus brevis]|nr:single-stranded DNA-binding protein [Levilactobacillus brevis]
MINRVVMTGRLTKDPELRYTQSGVAATTFNLAVDRRFKNQNNEREADFVNCVVWRKSAENFANFFHKGSLVGVEGRIQTRNYENQQGQRIYVTEVVVEDFAFLEPMNRSNQQNGYNSGYSARPQGQQSQSQNNQHRQPTQQNQGYNSPNNGGSGIDISDADLPF